MLAFPQDSEGAPQAAHPPNLGEMPDLVLERPFGFARQRSEIYRLTQLDSRS